jgi:hypothetical protein
MFKSELEEKKDERRKAHIQSCEKKFVCFWGEKEESFLSRFSCCSQWMCVVLITLSSSSSSSSSSKVSIEQN